MLGSQTMELGPFNVPVWLLAAIGGYLAAIGVQRVFLRGDREVFALANDLITTAVVVTLAVWKLTPLVTRFNEVVQSPTRLIYYPGGTAGVVVGVFVAAGVVSWIFVRRRRRAEGTVARVGRLALAAAVTVAFVVVPIAAVSIIPSSSRSATPAGEVVLIDPSGTSIVDLESRIAGRPTVLVFWATWCGPCTAQMPEIQRFYDDNRESAELLAVNLTTTEADEQTVTKYLNAGGYTFPVVLDNRDALRRAQEVRATPTVLVFDASGTEVARRTGAVTADWIERRVLPLL